MLCRSCQRLQSYVNFDSICLLFRAKDTPATNADVKMLKLFKVMGNAVQHPEIICSKYHQLLMPNPSEFNHWKVHVFLPLFTRRSLAVFSSLCKFVLEMCGKIWMKSNFWKLRMLNHSDVTASIFDDATPTARRRWWRSMQRKVMLRRVQVNTSYHQQFSRILKQS